jgi:hypothetical protein
MPHSYSIRHRRLSTQAFAIAQQRVDDESESAQILADTHAGGELALLLRQGCCRSMPATLLQSPITLIVAATFEQQPWRLAVPVKLQVVIEQPDQVGFTEFL